jgi:hypothetical protein
VSSIGNNLPGDFNFNGIVDAADYTFWRASVGAMGPHPADGDGNGVVDENDYGIWRANFGKTAPTPATGSALSGVPEPGSALLGCAIAVWAYLVRRRRCS